MSVISLAPLVVVADKRNSLFSIIEAVLVAVAAAGQRFRKFSYDKLENAAVIAGQARVHHLLGSSLYWGMIHPNLSPCKWNGESHINHSLSPQVTAQALFLVFPVMLTKVSGEP